MARAVSRAADSRISSGEKSSGESGRLRNDAFRRGSDGARVVTTGQEESGRPGDGEGVPLEWRAVQDFKFESGQEGSFGSMKSKRARPVMVMKFGGSSVK